MAQGKKYNDDIKEKAFAMLATNCNLSEVAKQLNIPITTLATWRKQLSDDKEDIFVKLRNKNKKQFIDDAWKIIRLSQENIIKAFEKAKESGEPVDIGKTATLMGIMYDKQALANNDSTMNLGVASLEDLIKKVKGENEY